MLASLQECSGFSPFLASVTSLIAAGDYVRHANKSPKLPYCAMVRGVQKRSGIHIWGQITTKVSPFFPLVGPIITISFNEIE